MFDTRNNSLIFVLASSFDARSVPVALSQPLLDLFVSEVLLSSSVLMWILSSLLFLQQLVTVSFSLSDSELSSDLRGRLEGGGGGLVESSLSLASLTGLSCVYRVTQRNTCIYCTHVKYRKTLHIA